MSNIITKSPNMGPNMDKMDKMDKLLRISFRTRLTLPLAADFPRNLAPPGFLTQLVALQEPICGAAPVSGHCS